jgi:four helix bundle protein
MEKTKHYQDLLVWQKSIDLAEIIYTITRSFPKEEIYGIISQMRRCSVSIASNIAEGQSRNSAPQFIQFLNIAKGSISELETQLVISKRLKFISEQDFNKVQKDLSDIGKMLNGLIKAIK